MLPDQAVIRCVGVFDALASEAAGLGLSELSRRLNVSKSGLHRSLNTLVALGYVSQDAASENYCLTMRLTTLGLRHLSAMRIQDVCQPILDALAATTGELVRMAIVEGETISWIAQAQGSRAGLRFDPEMGREILLHATATGKIWLASMSNDDAIRLMLRQGFADPSRIGPRACRSVETFVKALEQTRRRGIGVAVDEIEAGTSALAVAIRYSPADRVVGTLSIAGPTARLNAERIDEFAKLAKAAAKDLGSIWPIVHVDSRGARVDSNYKERPSEGGNRWIRQALDNS
jgi:IclR family transcriptional regulator, acetate operon repressor